MTEPPSSGAATALEKLCRTLGVQRGYESGGSFHAAPTESLVAALRALGAPLESPDSAAEALRVVRSVERDRPVPPTVVSWTDEPPSIPLQVPVDAAMTPVEVECVLEDGSRAARLVDPREIRWDEKGSTGHLSLPATLPPGYHEVRVAAGGREGRAFLVRAPRRTWSPERTADPQETAGPRGTASPRGTTGPRKTGGPQETGGLSEPPHRRGRWASFLPLHALRTEGGWGAGDLADLRALSEWTAERGGARVGILPLYDTFLGDGPRAPDRATSSPERPGSSRTGSAGKLYDPSPYSPISRQFWNPLWIALEEAPGLDACPEARALLDDGEVRGRARELHDADTVDYRAVMALKRRVLAHVAEAEAHRGGGPHGLGERLTRRVREDPEALAYARFRATLEATGEPWRRWEGTARGGDADALDPPDATVRYHVYAQWAVQRQLEDLADAAPAGLYLDLPLGSHPGGFDHWRHQACFARDFRVGAPPDAFFEGGQDWGFLPLHPHRIREDGHLYWASCLGRTMAVADALRLDHVMSLHRLFWIPRGAAAAEGVYVRYPEDELWAVLCLESHRHETEVVGEDLGTVPPEVPRAMERHGARRMWVLPFEVAADEDDPAGYRVNAPDMRSVAALDTHDLPPFAAFLDGTDIDTRVEEGRLGEEEARTEREHRARWRAALAACLRDRGHLEASEPDASTLLRAALRFLGSSDADLVVVNLEDLWLETEPQNVPGTPSTSNWTRKARLSLEEMTRDGRVRELLELVERSLENPGST